MNFMGALNYMGLGETHWLFTFPATFALFLVWSFFWKGFALWHAAKRGEKWWFIIFLVVNTVGILEITYIFFIAKIPEFRSKLGLK